MNTTATLPPQMVPDRDEAYRLRAAYERVVDGCRDELVLAFDGGSLLFRVDPDTDSLEARFDAADFEPTPEYRPLIGTALDCAAGADLGWTWAAVNQQGYCDTALLSFAGVVPSVLIHAIGSSVRVFAIDPAGR